MSSIELLDKTRRIGRLLHNNNSRKVVFSDICKVMRDILSANVIVLSKKGKVLGVGNRLNAETLGENVPSKVGQFVDEKLNARFLGILSTQENVNLETLGFDAEKAATLCALVTPIEIAGDRLGTLIVYREDEAFGIDDIIVSEYGTTVVGLEMIRSVTEEQAAEARKVAVVKSAIGTLSNTELEAMIYIFDELDGTEGILIASKIADSVGITRSVIVNALRKFESAGVIESKSAGMKGTSIKVVNDAVYQELDVARHEILHMDAE